MIRSIEKEFAQSRVAITTRDSVVDTQTRRRQWRPAFTCALLDGEVGIISKALSHKEL